MSAPVQTRDRTPGDRPAPAAPAFSSTLARHGLPPLSRARATTLQINVHHCHVEAGPKRTESMPAEVAARVIEVLEANPGLGVLDITGGAPEMNSHFRRLVAEARRLGREVIDRCNLTIFFEPGHEDLPEFLAAHAVHVIASLPCYQRENVDRQRGRGTFDRSIHALLRLNALAGRDRPCSSTSSTTRSGPPCRRRRPRSRRSTGRSSRGSSASSSTACSRSPTCRSGASRRCSSASSATRPT